MSADWKAGDKALCVQDVDPRAPEFFLFPNGNPVKQHIYLVNAVGLVPHDCVSAGEVGLFIAGFPLIDIESGTEYPRVSSRFRKIVPACDRNEREQTELHPHQGFWTGRNE